MEQRRHGTARLAFLALAAAGAPAYAASSDPFESAPVVTAPSRSVPRPHPSPAIEEPPAVEAPPAAQRRPIYDGVYVGTMNLTWDSGTCGRPSFERMLSVDNNQVTFLFNKIYGVVVTGTVGLDGTVSGFGNSGIGGTRLTGRIQGNQLVGVAESPRCHYSLQLIRR